LLRLEEDARLTAMWLWTLSTANDERGTQNAELETARGKGEDATSEREPQGEGALDSSFIVPSSAFTLVAN